MYTYLCLLKFLDYDIKNNIILGFNMSLLAAEPIVQIHGKIPKYGFSG